ncbi:hypothetical protein [Sphingomonas sp. dw_22]|uniref:hypothetical protein n=1 Tax=Sphingomonas sp. dw_22 TaxID=2721175 RepID=UPI001BD1FB26|nr:hypothetical protein [Sphingomonas sp. dw_22]
MVATISIAMPMMIVATFTSITITSRLLLDSTDIAVPVLEQPEIGRDLWCHQPEFFG